MERAPKIDGMGVGEKSDCSRMLMIAGCLLWGVCLALQGGCATTEKVKVALVEPPKPAPAVAGLSAPQPTAPSVVHFTDGREGFVIKEPAGTGLKSAPDFDQANAMIKEEQYDKAVPLLEKVIAQSPGVAGPHINLAIAYGRMNKPEQAEEHLKKALELIPGHPVASNEYGLLLRKAGRFAESRRVYEKSLAAFPEYYPIQKNLAILCDLYLKDLACATEHYEIYGKAVPKDPQVNLWLADLHTRWGKNVTASATQNGTTRP